MTNDELPEEWEILRDWLPADLEGLAKKHGFMRRTTGRIGAEMWLRLILMHVAGGLSLEQTMLRASELGWTGLTAVALHKRLRKSQEWLCALCAELLKQQRCFLGKKTPWPRGWKVRLIDATNIQEPGNTGTDWRVHYSLRMPHMICDHYEITSSKGGEKFARFEFKPGELAVADRGYSHRPGVAYVMDCGAEVLVRWNPAGFPLEDKQGKCVDMLDWLKSLPARASKEKKVWFSYQGRRYELRLCAMRKSQLATERARKKVREKARLKSRNVQPETLEYAAYVMILCSCAEKLAPRDAVLNLYRGRWQVELAFKRLKSLLDAGHVPKYNDETAKSWMQAKILSALLIERTLWEGEFLSPWGYGIGLNGSTQQMETVR